MAVTAAPTAPSITRSQKEVVGSSPGARCLQDREAGWGQMPLPEPPPRLLGLRSARTGPPAGLGPMLQLPCSPVNGDDCFPGRGLASHRRAGCRYPRASGHGGEPGEHSSAEPGLADTREGGRGRQPVSAAELCG